MSHNSGQLFSLCIENSETVVPVSSGYQQLGIMGNGEQVRGNLQIRTEWSSDTTA